MTKGKNIKDRLYRFVALDVLAVFAMVGIAELLGGFTGVNTAVAAIIVFFAVDKLW